MYTSDNTGYFPAAARADRQEPNDFIFWQQPSIYWNSTLFSVALGKPRSLDNGALVRYLGKHFYPQAWTCPSDDPGSHLALYTLVPGVYPHYPYSYAMNYLLDSTYDSVGPTAWMGGVVKISRVRHSSATIMMVEEGASTINDGTWVMTRSPDSAPVPGPDFLAVRHDRTAILPEGLLSVYPTIRVQPVARRRIVLSNYVARWPPRRHHPPNARTLPRRRPRSTVAVAVCEAIQEMGIICQCLLVNTRSGKAHPSALIVC